MGFIDFPFRLASIPPFVTAEVSDLSGVNARRTGTRGTQGLTSGNDANRGRRDGQTSQSTFKLQPVS